MVSRDDNVVTIYYPDGTTVVEHHDGTRITVYYRQYRATSQDEFGDQGELVLDSSQSEDCSARLVAGYSPLFEMDIPCREM